MFPSNGENHNNSVAIPHPQIKPEAFFPYQLIAPLNQEDFLLLFYVSESINFHLAGSFSQLSESKFTKKRSSIYCKLFFLYFLMYLSCFLSLGFGHDGGGI